MGGGDFPSTFDAREGGAYGEEADDEAVRSGRALAWIPASGEAPMPGDPVQVRDFVAALQAKAVEIRDYTGEVSRLTPEWTGTTANSFMTLKDTLPPKMEMIAERFDAVAAALDAYADELSDAQDEADGAVQAAGTARDNLDNAQADSDNAEAELDGRTVQEWKEENEGEMFPYSEDFETDLTDAQDALLDAWNDFKAAYSSRWTAAETCQEAIADAISHTGESGSLNDAPREQASEDADQLESLLEQQGIDINDYDGSEVHITDDEAGEDLYELLQSMGDRYGEGAYSEILFDELGADGIRATLSAIEGLGRTYDGEYINPFVDGDVEAELLDPFVENFAEATNTLDSDVLDELADPGDFWRNQHYLAVLLGADGSLYEPQFLANAADVLLVSERSGELATGHEVPGLDIGPGSTTSVLESLAQNPEAAWLFVDKGSANLEYLLEGPPEGDAVAADVFTAAFVDAPTQNPDLLPDAIDAYAQVVDIVGEGDIPDPVKLAVAGSHIVYLDAIGDAATTQSPDEFNRPDMVAFYAELAHSPEAMVVLAEGISLWGAQQGAVLATDLDNSESTAMKPVAMVTGAVMHGLEATNADLESALDAWAAGLSSGIIVAGSAALVLIPEPSTSLSGGALLATQMGRAGAVSAIGLGVSGTSENAADAIAGRDTGTGLEVADVGAMVVGELRVPLAEALAEETGEEMPTGIPPEGERWNGDGDWWNETDEVINEATPDGMTNPADQLDQMILDQASEGKYPDPEDDNWRR